MLSHIEFSVLSHFYVEIMLSELRGAKVASLLNKLRSKTLMTILSVVTVETCLISS
jgi:hypothetical protein